MKQMKERIMTSTGDKKEESTNGRQLREDSRYKMRVKLIFAADIIATFIAYFFSLWLRFDFQFSKIPLNYLQHLLILFPIICATTLIVYRACHLYQSIWR